MRANELIEAYPRLYHMAEDGSWPSIQQHGLLSTAALVELFEVPEDERIELLRARRPDMVMLHHPVHGTAVIRDNKPLHEKKLRHALLGMTPPDWYALLNERVFFWVREARLLGLLGARAYRERPHVVITIDTQRLVDAHRRRITLSPINSGSTAYVAAARGRDTFRSIADYPFEERQKAGPDAVVELAVSGSVPDIQHHALRVERWHPSGRRQRIWPS